MKFLVIDWAAALNVAGFSFFMVFLLLIFIVLILSISGRFFVNLEKTRKRRAEQLAKATGPVVELAESDAEAENVPNEVAVAIGLAVRSIRGFKHDKESNVITIVKGDKRYSPWSSKIYGLSAFRRN